MSARGELPDVPANAIEQLLAECQVMLRRLLIVGVAGLACALLLALLGIAALAGRAS